MPVITYHTDTAWIILQMSEWLSFTAFLGQRDPYNPYKLYDHNLYIGLIIYPHMIKKETPIKLTGHWGQ